jgi:hypothetical protein
MALRQMTNSRGTLDPFVVNLLLLFLRELFLKGEFVERTAMRNYRSTSVLASLLALLVAAPLSAGQLPDPKLAQEAAQDVEQEVAQGVDQEEARKPEPAPSQQPTALEQEALPVAGELAPGAPDPLTDPLTAPLPEPEEVLKTKTKSNQSND